MYKAFHTKQKWIVCKRCPWLKGRKHDWTVAKIWSAPIISATISSVTAVPSKTAVSAVIGTTVSVATVMMSMMTKVAVVSTMTPAERGRSLLQAQHDQQAEHGEQHDRLGRHSSGCWLRFTKVTRIEVTKSGKIESDKRNRIVRSEVMTWASPRIAFYTTARVLIKRESRRLIGNFNWRRATFRYGFHPFFERLLQMRYRAEGCVSSRSQADEWLRRKSRKRVLSGRVVGWRKEDGACIGPGQTDSVNKAILAVDREIDERYVSMWDQTMNEGKKTFNKKRSRSWWRINRRSAKTKTKTNRITRSGKSNRLASEESNDANDDGKRWRSKKQLIGTGGQNHYWGIEHFDSRAFTFARSPQMCKTQTSLIKWCSMIGNIFRLEICIGQQSDRQ